MCTTLMPHFKHFRKHSLFRNSEVWKLSTIFFDSSRGTSIAKTVGSTPYPYIRHVFRRVAFWTLQTSNKATRNSQMKLGLGSTVPYRVHAAACDSEHSEPGSNNLGNFSALDTCSYELFFTQ